MVKKFDYAASRFLMFDIDEMANQMEKEGEEIIRLTLGKSELPLCQEITNAMKNVQDSYESYSLVYPTGLPELKDALSKFIYQQYGCSVPNQNIIVSLGTSSIFRNLFEILLEKGDEVLLPKPYYSLYRFCAQLVGAEIKYYDIDIEKRKIDFSSIERNFSDKTKVVVVNTPGNPLGNVISDEEMYLLDEIVAGKATIICDEIYSNVYFDQPNKSVMQLKNTQSIFIPTNAFSKAYRMYSKRVGYCIVPDVLIEPMTVIQHHTLLTVDPVVQFGAIEAIKHQDEVQTLVDKYRLHRNYVVDRFRICDNVNVIYPEGGFYATLDCKKFMDKNNISSSYELARELICKTNVATVPGSDFGLPTTLRLSFSSNKFTEGVDRLVEYFCK